MTITDRIEINPRVMLGKPVIRGTRITVELILRKLSESASEAELLDAYPRLAREDIQAAIGSLPEVGPAGGVSSTTTASRKEGAAWRRKRRSGP